jgi:hypothetical protein
MGRQSLQESNARQENARRLAPQGVETIALSAMEEDSADALSA